MPDPKAVTYAELVKILADLDYVPDVARSAATYTIFQHPDRPLPIFLQVRPADEPVRATFLVMVESILRENDPDSAREFEDRIHGRSGRALHGLSVS